MLPGTCAVIESSESFASETCFAVIGVLVGEMVKGHRTNPAERLRHTAAPHPVIYAEGKLDRRSERPHGLYANDRRNQRNLEAMVGIAQELFDRFGIEPTADLLRCRDGKTGAGEFGQAAALHFVFERFALAFGALQTGVGIAERIGKRFIGKIVRSGSLLGLG